MIVENLKKALSEIQRLRETGVCEFNRQDVEQCIDLGWLEGPHGPLTAKGLEQLKS